MRTREDLGRCGQDNRAGESENKLYNIPPVNVSLSKRLPDLSSP